MCFAKGQASWPVNLKLGINTPHRVTDGQLNKLQDDDQQEKPESCVMSEASDIQMRKKLEKGYKLCIYS